MKKYIFIHGFLSFILYTFLLYTFSSCDTRKDYFKDINKAPDLLLKKTSGTDLLVHLTDSLKFSQGSYTFFCQVVDEEKDLAINPRLISGAGSFDVDNTLKTIKFIPTKIQNAKFYISVSDIYTTSTDTVDLVIFQNLIPVTNFEVIKTQVNSPYECKIDAASSYDRDARFGGSIVKYEYHIGLVYTVTTTLSNINYIFQGTGNYDIKVRVQDNDGAWSDYKSIIYSL